MIREYRAGDVEAILDIWLQASIIAHDFIDKKFWEANVAAMRDVYLPASQTYVHEEDGSVTAFLSLDGPRIAALFVAPGAQGRGVGSLLVDKAKHLHGTLHLAVYERNKKAVDFYARKGFSVVDRRIEAHTGQHELTMRFIG